MCLVNPYEQLRRELKDNNQDQMVEVLLISDRDLRKEYHVVDFEKGNPEITLNTDLNVEDTFVNLINCIKEKGYC
jgi:hypothetical protein